MRVVEKGNKWQQEAADIDAVRLSRCGNIRLAHFERKLYRSPAGKRLGWAVWALKVSKYPPPRSSINNDYPVVGT